MSKSILRLNGGEMQIIDEALDLLNRRIAAGGLLKYARLEGAMERLAADYGIPRECHTCASSCDINCYSSCKDDCHHSCKGDCQSVSR